MYSYVLNSTLAHGLHSCTYLITSQYFLMNIGICQEPSISLSVFIIDHTEDNFLLCIEAVFYILYNFLIFVNHSEISF